MLGRFIEGGGGGGRFFFLNFYISVPFNAGRMNEPSQPATTHLHQRARPPHSSAVRERQKKKKKRRTRRVHNRTPSPPSPHPKPSKETLHLVSFFFLLFAFFFQFSAESEVLFTWFPSGFTGFLTGCYWVVQRVPPTLALIRLEVRFFLFVFGSVRSSDFGWRPAFRRPATEEEREKNKTKDDRNGPFFFFWSGPPVHLRGGFEGPDPGADRRWSGRFSSLFL